MKKKKKNQLFANTVICFSSDAISWKKGWLWKKTKTSKTRFETTDKIKFKKLVIKLGKPALFRI